MRRLLNDLRQSQSDCWLRAEVLGDGFDEQYVGIADAHRVIKSLAANERLENLIFNAPIGIDPLNQTNRTQSVGVGPAISSPANKTLAIQPLSLCRRRRKGPSASPIPGSRSPT